MEYPAHRCRSEPGCTSSRGQWNAPGLYANRGYQWGFKGVQGDVGALEVVEEVEQMG